MIIINGKIVNKGIGDKELKRAVLFTLKKLNKENFDISINFVSGSEIRFLNNKYRKKNKITDVLSFAALEGEKVGESKELGDIFICLSQIKRQAKEYKVDFKEELIRMLVHGILHLIGYDHISKRDEQVMFKLQEKMVKSVCD